MNDAVKASVESLIALWNSTEKVVKEAELIGGALIQPSINELRYAGRWLVLALDAILKNKNQIDRLTTVESAISYASLCCMQAKHDAIDSVVLYMHEKIDQLNDRYTTHTIAMYVKDYEEFLTEVAEVDRSIVLSRGERENRLELYEKVVSHHLPKLADFLKRIRLAEIHINKEIQDELEMEETERRDREEVQHNLQTLLSNAQAESARNRKYFRISMAINAALIMLGILALIPLMKSEHSDHFTSLKPAAANSSSIGAKQDVRPRH